METSDSIEERTEWLVQQSLRTGDDEDDEDILEELSLHDASTADASESQPGLSTEASLASSNDEEQAQFAALEAQRSGPSAQRPGTDPQCEDADFDEEHGPVFEEHMSEVAAAESHHWGRIIRQPRKRNKHIIFDVCAAAASLPRHQQEELSMQHAAERPLLRHGKSGNVQRDGARQLGKEGVLMQQVIASADKKGWLGPAGYRLARKARWGDLWPTYYANRAITPRVTQSRTGAAGDKI